MARFYPSLDRIRNLVKKSMPGEWFMLDFLATHLEDDQFEVYFQPWLRGRRPDIVVVRRGGGILLIEVKDWTIESASYDADTKDVKLKSSKGEVRSLREAIDQVEGYKDRLFLLAEGVWKANLENSKIYGIAKCLVFLNHADESVLETCAKLNRKNSYWVIGKPTLRQPDFWKELMEVTYLDLDKNSYYFNDKIYQAVTEALFLPDRVRAKHQALGATLIPGLGMNQIRFSSRQEEFVRSAPRFQKARGVAGSGKTLVLAVRAWNAVKRHGGRVLVVCYNITLVNYIEDKLASLVKTEDYEDLYYIDVVNYHELISSVFEEITVPEEVIIQDDEKRENWLEDNIFSNEEAIKTLIKIDDKFEYYRTILVDEVQDFKNEWLRILQNCFLDPDDREFVVFGDAKQDIYGRIVLEPGNSRKQLVVPQVPGRWWEFKETFRFFNKIKNFINAFQLEFMRDSHEIEKIETQQHSLFEGEIEYYHFSPLALHKDIAEVFIQKLKALLEKHENFHIGDVALVGSSVSRLRRFAEALKREIHRDWNLRCTFETPEEFLNFVELVLKDLEINYLLLPVDEEEGGNGGTQPVYRIANMDDENDRRVVAEWMMDLLTRAQVMDDFERAKKISAPLWGSLKSQVQPSKSGKSYRVRFPDAEVREITLKRAFTLQNIQNWIDWHLSKLRKERKLHFTMQAKAIKISTTHSFKGWESSAVFYLIEERDLEPGRIELFYTAFTRARSLLVLFNLGSVRLDRFVRNCPFVTVIDT